ncbi:MAG: hypothetical protein KAH48_06065 [Chlorobi bacterium]|nr:hypothetical protein [Chlorobiota bacterium]
MNLYLDIDGVLLTKHGKHKPADLEEFIDIILEYFDCYWLTTHCKADSEPTIRYLSEYFDCDLLEKFKQIKPTNWQTLKTEAIDFSSDFIWCDDDPLRAEIRILEGNKVGDRLFLVDLGDKFADLTAFARFIRDRFLY